MSTTADALETILDAFCDHLWESFDVSEDSLRELRELIEQLRHEHEHTTACMAALDHRDATQDED